MSDSTKRFIFAGYSADVAIALGAVGMRRHVVFLCDETTDADAAARLPTDAVVVYVWGPFTGSSSQLHGHFAWLHHALKPPSEFLVFLPAANPRALLFQCVANVPMMSLTDLRELVSGYPPTE